MENLLSTQREWLQALQTIRTPLLNDLFLFLNLFDTEYFPLLLLPIVWSILPPPWGARLLYLFTISAFTNSALKHLFTLPRPCAHLEDLCLVSLHSFSFPSGGAQTAMLFGGLLFLSSSSKFWRGTALVYILLISFSRTYLGVHYPTDILGGWFIGGLLLFLYLRTVHPIESFFRRISLEKGLLYSLVLPWFGLVLYPSSAALFPISSASAMGLGIYLLRKYHLWLPACPSWRMALLRLATVLLGTFLIYIPLQTIHNFGVQELLVPALILLWLSAGMGWLLKTATTHQR